MSLNRQTSAKIRLLCLVDDCRGASFRITCETKAGVKFYFVLFAFHVATLSRNFQNVQELGFSACCAVDTGEPLTSLSHFDNYEANDRKAIENQTKITLALTNVLKSNPFNPTSGAC